MANLMSTGGYPILHTYSKYSKNAINTNFIPQLQFGNSLESDKTRMQNKEREFYKKYGANSHTEFINKISNLFPKNDRQVFARFEAEFLSKELRRFSMTNRYLYEYEEAVSFNFDFTQLKQLKDIQLAPNAKPFAILPKMDKQKMIGQIKGLINENFMRRFHKGSAYTKDLDNFITSLIKSGALRITLGKTSENGEFESKEEYEVHSIPNFPWGLTKDVYEQAKKDNNKVILNEVAKAILDIYSFLLNTLGQGASADMRLAITRVWSKLFQSGSNPAQFFSGGKTNSFISGVQGAMGEFQTALLFEYLQIKGMTNAYAEIKGNTRLESTITKEQARTDVQIFEGMGIQVKNFVTIEREINGKTQTQFLQDIHTRIHPDKLAKSFPSQTQDNFLSFMANFYFNKDFEQANFRNMIELRYALESWIGSIMNMAVSDAVEDTVTFYMIGGKYFVPCSIILAASQRIGVQQSLKIYSAFEGKSDKEFARSEENKSPLYSLYWERDKGGWKYTSENENLSKNLINSRISIQTRFNFFDEIKKCALL